MPSEKPLRHFEDILENIARIERFTAGKGFDAFAQENGLSIARTETTILIGQVSDLPKQRPARGDIVTWEPSAWANRLDFVCQDSK